MNILDFLFIAEIPFFLATTIVAFIAAKKLEGGSFGTGMRLIAYGTLLMMVGHLYLFAQRIFGIALFPLIFGEIVGTIVLALFLLSIWVFYFLGFRSIIKSAA